MRGMRGVRRAAILAGLLAGCAPLEQGGMSAAGDREMGRQMLRAELRAESEDFAVSGRREIPVVFALHNQSRQAVRLDFPTEQHLEVTLRDPGGRVLFLWSEDRSFGAAPSQVVVNPMERLEFQAAVPTRDMIAGRVYAVEAGLPGYPETSATATLRPQ